MMPPQAGECKGCGAQVLWVRMPATGRPMPLDRRRTTIIVPETGAVVTGHLSHFATCPKAGEFRRPRGG